jgi:hypothetical protein
MDARRLRLYELLKPKLDEEPARELVLALAPQPDGLVTKGHLDRRLAQLETTLTWRMVTIMGAWSVIVSTAWATALAVLR